MPELPEVQTIIDSLKKEVINKRFEEIDIFYSKIIKVDVDIFKKKLLRAQIIDISRKGKYIIFTLSNNHFLIVHLKMTGHFKIVNKDAIKEKHEHIRFKFENLTLAYIDTRKFGTLYLTKEKNEVLKNTGIDALDPNLDFTFFYSLLGNSTKKIKSFLLDQSKISGLGNIYVDETLFQAKIHPEKKVNTINLNEARTLFNSIQNVLQLGIKNKGTSLGKNISNYSDIYGNFGSNQNSLKAYMQHNKKCHFCQSTILRKKIDQRSSFYCPTCQKK